jgi:hypothetical protein
MIRSHPAMPCTSLYPDMPVEIVVEVARHLLALDWRTCGRFCSRICKGLCPMLANILPTVRLAHYRDSYAAMLSWLSAPPSKLVYDISTLQWVQRGFGGPNISWRDDGVLRLGRTARGMLEDRQKRCGLTPSKEFLQAEWPIY